MRLNRHQIPASQQGIVDATEYVVNFSQTEAAAGRKDVGIPRIAGCYIHRATPYLNNVPMEGFTAVVIADSNSTTSAVRITIRGQVTELGDQILLKCVWKYGDNPLGVAALAADTATPVDESDDR